MTQFFAKIFASAVIVLTHMVTAVRADWIGCRPEVHRRIYFANHVSHGDFILTWTALPRRIRKQLRPVAGRDYWLKGPLRRFIATNVFRSVLIERTKIRRGSDPIDAMTAALDDGASILVFPEGTRNTDGGGLQPFKCGLYHLAARRPEIELVPVWISNLNRVLPKGAIVPIPAQCSVAFGAPLTLHAKESKAAFIARARNALLGLAKGAGYDPV